MRLAVAAPPLFSVALASLLGCASGGGARPLHRVGAPVVDAISPATAESTAPGSATEATSRAADPTAVDPTAVAGADGSASEAGEPAPTAGSPAFRLVYRLSGGFAGFDVTFRVDGDGSMVYERRRPALLKREARLEPAARRDLRELVHQSGFLELEARYLPQENIADGFEYVLRWEEQGRTKEVIAGDGAKLPEAFLRVREAVQALEQRTLGKPALE